MGMIEITDLRGRDPAMRRVALPSLARDAAGPRSSVARLDIRGEAALQGAVVAFEPTDIEPRTRTGLVIDVLVGGMPVTVALDRTLPGLDGLEDLAPLALAPQMLALALEHVLTPDLELFEAAQSTQIEIREVVETRFDTGQAVAALRLVEQGGSVFTAHIWGADNEALAEALKARFPLRPGLKEPRITVPARVLGPVCELPKKRLRKLKRGAVICPSYSWTDVEGELHLLVKDTHLVRLAPSGHGFVTEGDDIDMADLGGGTAGENMEHGRKGSLANPKAVVTVELHRTEMTLQELGALGEGKVLDFDVKGIEEVTLAADGRPFARGKLVQLDEALGVMVTKLL